MKFGMAAVMTAAMMMAGCVSDSDLGAKNRELTEAESPAIYTGSEFDGGNRHFTYGRAVDYSGKWFLVGYASKKGNLPNILFQFTKLASNRNFWNTTLAESISGWTSYSENPPPLGAGKFVVSDEGRIDYADFKDGAEHCIYFLRTWGSGFANLSGNKRIEGMYCDKDPISELRAEKALLSIEIRNDGELLKVAAKEAADEPQNKESKPVFGSQQVNFQWNGVVVPRPVELSYKMFTDRDGVVLFQVEEAGKCNADVTLVSAVKNASREKPAEGNWHFTCDKGLKGSGWVKVYPEQDGSLKIDGGGKDREGRKLSFSSLSG